MLYLSLGFVSSGKILLTIAPSVKRRDYSLSCAFDDNCVFWCVTSLTLLRFWIFVLFFGMIIEIADTINPSARSVVEFDEEMVTSQSTIPRFSTRLQSA
jgi:hypothetical protein